MNLTRRRLLSAGGLGFLGLNLATCCGPIAIGDDGGGPPRARPIKSCILMFYYGGPSHHDTWDMKPTAPARGPRRVRQHRHQRAGHSHLRALAALGQDHGSAGRDSQRASHDAQPQRGRGRGALRPHAAPGRPGAAGQRPDHRFSLLRLGAELSQRRRARTVPSHVALPHVMYNVVKLPGQTAGFLGPAYEPLQVAKDPNAADFRVGEIELPAGMTLGRARKSPGAAVARSTRQLDVRAWQSAGRARMNAYYDRAFNLLRVRRRAARVRHQPRRPRKPASATAATFTARARCWPGGWSRRACGSSASTTR